LSDTPDDNADPIGLPPWEIEGVSAEAIERAKKEAERRGLLLAELIEEVIEHALIAEKNAAPDPDAGI